MSASPRSRTTGPPAASPANKRHVEFASGRRGSACRRARPSPPASPVSTASAPDRPLPTGVPAWKPPHMPARTTRRWLRRCTRRTLLRVTLSASSRSPNRIVSSTWAVRRSRGYGSSSDPVDIEEARECDRVRRLHQQRAVACEANDVLPVNAANHRRVVEVAGHGLIVTNSLREARTWIDLPHTTSAALRSLDTARRLGDSNHRGRHHLRGDQGRRVQ